MNPKITAIIVTYNGMHWYDRCLGSLRESEIPVDTIVIDNASSDDSVAYIKEHFPEVHLIESKENLGFAKANNIGMRKALDDGADYVFLLNQDAWVERNTLTELIKSFRDNDSVGIAAPIHMNGSYSGLDLNFALYMGTKFTSDAFMQTVNPYYTVPFINAAAWLICKDCLETVGGFDTSLFRHYGEDDNYCQRLEYHKLQIVVNTRCTICHDREDRKNEGGKNLANQVPFYEERIYLGNINFEWNIPNKIKDLKRKKLLKFIRGKYNACKTIEEQIGYLLLIETSRQKNKLRGPHWL